MAKRPGFEQKCDIFLNHFHYNYQKQMLVNLIFWIIWQLQGRGLELKA